MRIIAGIAKGMVLAVPRGDDTRQSRRFLRPARAAVRCSSFNSRRSLTTDSVDMVLDNVRLTASSGLASALGASFFGSTFASAFFSPRLETSAGATLAAGLVTSFSAPVKEAVCVVVPPRNFSSVGICYISAVVFMALTSQTSGRNFHW